MGTDSGDGQEYGEEFVEIVVTITCDNAYGLPYWQGTEVFEADECLKQYDLRTGVIEYEEGLLSAVCPKCGQEPQVWEEGVTLHIDPEKNPELKEPYPKFGGANDFEVWPPPKIITFKILD